MTRWYILRYLVTLHFLIKFLFNVNENCVYICGNVPTNPLKKIIKLINVYINLNKDN